MLLHAHVGGLNEAQLRAVQHPPNVPLQILAGPGSGKTRVLTSRIVQLIRVHDIPPSGICAVTFTNKAANEMKERLSRLLGKDIVSAIKMGTFHSLCARFVRRYAGLLGVEGNFTVCDADESKKIVTKLLKPFKTRLVDRDVSLTEGTVLSRISKAKAKGLTPKDIVEKRWHASSSKSKGKEKAIDFDDDFNLEQLDQKDVVDEIVARVFFMYQATLRENNSLDFDDLLVFGVKLFKDHSHVSKWCQHILVDEFQDTNTMQYELMRHIASSHRCLTVVGDPDQSIYGWRSAEVENLARMKRDFVTTQQILLEHNYRSTAAILAASIAIVEQDKTRIPKTLHTTHAEGPKPILRDFPTAELEASSIALEIKRLSACSGGMLGFNDFSILLRYNALSRVLESALQREGIPSRILGGHRFFERLEVKDLLAYLQLIDNPCFAPAFARVINIPARSIGEKTITEILTVATRMNLTPLDVVERIHDGKVPDIKPPVKRKIGGFVKAVRKLRNLANEHETPADLIRSLLELIGYEEHLKKTQQDWESRWENVQELINFASETEADLLAFASEQATAERGQSKDDDWGDVVEDEYEEEELDDLGFTEIRKSSLKKQTEDKLTPLRAFLQMTMLSTDTETSDESDEQKKKERVTISTCHAAKGLEWPVVFVPAVEAGIFPAARAEDPEEERRLLYVACTRAQCLLYLTHASSRMRSGETMHKDLSEFITPLRSHPKGLLANIQPEIGPSERALFSVVLSRSVPGESDVNKRVADLKRTGKPLAWPPSASSLGPSNCFSGGSSAFALPCRADHSKSGAVTVRTAGFQERATVPEVPVTMSFVSAKSTLNAPAQLEAECSVPLSPSRTFPNRCPTTSSTAASVKPVSNIGSNLKHKEAAKSQTKPRSSPLAVGENAGSIATWLRRKPVSEKLDSQFGIPKLVHANSRVGSATSKSSIGEVVVNSRANIPHAPSREYRTAISSGPVVHDQGDVLPGTRSRSDQKLACNLSTASKSETVVHTAPGAAPAANPKPAVGGTKRRLGMSRAVVGYPNKKFKTPT